MANYFANARNERKLAVDAFRGLDLANSKVSVSKGRSIDCLNIISDLAGKPVKRTGYKTVINIGKRINGIHRLKTAEVEDILVHAGDTLYKWDMSAGSIEQLKTGLNDARSISIQYNGQLVIIDGLKMLAYGEFDETYQVKTAEEAAYIPTVLINADADKEEPGGTVFDSVNLLTGKRYVDYVINPDSENSSFKLYVPEGKLTDGEWLIAEKINDDGDWNEITIASKDYTNGYITINKSEVSDVPKNVDNVRIGYYVAPKKDGGADKINKCTVAKLFGVGGNTNRLFIGGSSEEPNKVYYSGLDEMLYFPDTGYLTVGADSSDVMGFSRVSDYLAVHKEDNGQDSSVFLISGTLDMYSKPVFSVKAGVSTNGAISKYAFAEFSGEPLYLTANGVYAITTQEITFEKYAENRSYYINPKLINNDLSDACAIEYNSYYYLSVGNGDVYIADSRQKVYENNQPMSSYQYEWYYFRNIPARIWWEYENDLYFGTADGKIKRMYNANEHTVQTNAYEDDGEPVKAYWCTPYFYFDSMIYYKNLRALSLMLAPYSRTSADVYYRAGGREIAVVKDNGAGDVFSFNDIDFTRFTFRTDDSPVIIATDNRLKKFMLIQFKFANDNAEPFGIYGFEVQFTVTANYKG